MQAWETKGVDHGLKVSRFITDYDFVLTQSILA